jgi:hypothetical protein
MKQRGALNQSWFDFIVDGARAVVVGCWMYSNLVFLVWNLKMNTSEME